MDDETRTEIEAIGDRLVELETIIKAHRALISQHQSALKTVAQIMGEPRNVDDLSPGPDLAP